MSYQKPFSKKLKNQYDGVGREAALDYLQVIANETDLKIDNVWENPEKTRSDFFYPDLMVTFLNPDGERTEMGIEPEVCRAWGDSAFPYDDVRLPRRKQKWLFKPYEVLFLKSNRKGERFVVYGSEDVKEHGRTVRLKNSMSDNFVEDFYQLDKQHFLTEIDVRKALPRKHANDPQKVLRDRLAYWNKRLKEQEK